LAEETSEEDSLIYAPGRDEGVEDADADGEVSEPETHEDMESSSIEGVDGVAVESDVNKKVQGTGDVSSSDNRTHYVTRSRQQVKLHHLYDNYSMAQIEESEECRGQGEHTHSIRHTFGVVGAGNVARASTPENDAILHYASTQYSLKQALKLFPEEATNATLKEMHQLHNMGVFEPVHKMQLTQQERLQVLNLIIFLKLKRCGKLKAGACAGGWPQQAL
jgi:hypothetical protein